MKEKKDVKKRKKARKSRPLRSVNLVPLCAPLFACSPLRPWKLPPADTDLAILAILVGAVAVAIIAVAVVAIIAVAIVQKERAALLQLLWGGGVSFGILRRLVSRLLSSRVFVSCRVESLSRFQTRW